jgi:hypothetical protein
MSGSANPASYAANPETAPNLRTATAQQNAVWFKGGLVKTTSRWAEESNDEVFTKLVRVGRTIGRIGGQLWCIHNGKLMRQVEEPSVACPHTALWPDVPHEEGHACIPYEECRLCLHFISPEPGLKLSCCGWAREARTTTRASQNGPVTHNGKG